MSTFASIFYTMHGCDNADKSLHRAEQLLRTAVVSPQPVHCEPPIYRSCYNDVSRRRIAYISVN